MTTYVCIIYDRDGGIVEEYTDTFDTYAEADRYGNSCNDDPRHGSHEIEEEEEE